MSADEARTGQEMPGNKRLNKNAVIIIMMMSALLVVAIVFAILNAGDLEYKKLMQSDALFNIIVDGEVALTIGMDDFDNIGVSEIIANYKRSDMLIPEDVTFTGVPFAALLDYCGIASSDYGTVLFTAADGYNSAVSISDAMNREHCWIVIAREGEPLGTKADANGEGPFMMILAQDIFSIGWCKFLMEVTLG